MNALFVQLDILVLFTLFRSKSTYGVQVDSKSYAETLLGDDSTDHDRNFDNEGHSIDNDDQARSNKHQQGGNTEEDEEEADALRRLVLIRQEEMNGLPPLQRLLDKSVRPFWGGALSTMRGVDEHIMQKARKRTDMEHDISVFVNRPRPKTATLLTVSGLNKKVMETCWEQMHNNFAGKKKQQQGTTTTDSQGKPIFLWTTKSCVDV